MVVGGLVGGRTESLWLVVGFFYKVQRENIGAGRRPKGVEEKSICTSVNFVHRIRNSADRLARMQNVASPKTQNLST